MKNAYGPLQLSAMRSLCLNLSNLFFFSSNCLMLSITSCQVLHAWGGLRETLCAAYIIHEQICPPPEPCALCDLSWGQSHLYSFGWDCGIVGGLIGAFSLHGGPLQLLSVVPLTHLLYQYTPVIYIIQATRGCLWAPNHLLAFIS